MTADPRELRRLRTFYVGPPGSDDLRAAFVIDGRDYASPAGVRADVHAAVADLHHRRLSAQFVTRPVTPDSPRPDTPSWHMWRSQHPPTLTPQEQPDAGWHPGSCPG